jgi:phosphate ABC transporter phosphate-binding protein
VRAERVIALVALATLALTTANTATAAAVSSPVSGAGSTWAQNAVDQWRHDTGVLGLGTVNYSGTGSSNGRSQFASGANDFAMTDLGYAEAGETLPSRALTYLPMVAGGLSLAYNLTGAGGRVTALRLTADDIAGIFTGAITTWDDARLAHHNPGLALPHLRITAVVRSDAAGDSYRLSDYLKHATPAAWSSFCVAAGLGAGCPATSLWPTPSGAGLVAQVGALGVSGYVAQPSTNGSITYVGTSYAVNAGLPSAKVLNHGGYYVGPVAGNVSLTLLAATLSADGVPDVSSMIGSTDPRTYPLSMVSAMVAPTSVDSTFDTAKGLTLGGFAGYAICQGQQKASALGYAPLPLNLVQLARSRIGSVPGAATPPALTSCANPALSAGADALASTVAKPPVCDADAHIQCGTALIYSSLTTVGLSASRAVLVAGQPVALTARLAATSVRSAISAPVGHRVLRLERRRHGTTSWVAVADRITDSAGRASFVARPDSSSDYRVRFVAVGGYSGSAAVRTVRVRYAVTARSSSSVVRPAQAVVLTGVVGPRAPGRVVVLQELRGTTWVTRATARLTFRGGFVLRVTPQGRGLHRLRVQMPADASHLVGASPTVSVRVR